MNTYALISAQRGSFVVAIRIDMNIMFPLYVSLALFQKIIEDKVRMNSQRLQYWILTFHWKYSNCITDGE